MIIHTHTYSTPSAQSSHSPIQNAASFMFMHSNFKINPSREYLKPAPACVKNGIYEMGNFSPTFLDIRKLEKSRFPYFCAYARRASSLKFPFFVCAPFRNRVWKGVLEIFPRNYKKPAYEFVCAFVYGSEYRGSWRPILNKEMKNSIEIWPSYRSRQ